MFTTLKRFFDFCNVEDRKKLFLTGITEVGSFDDSGMHLFTELGELYIKGSALRISDMSVESGELNVEGEISSMSYESRKTKKRQGLLGRLSG